MKNLLAVVPFCTFLTACNAIGSLELPTINEKDFRFVSEVIYSFDCELSEAVQEIRKSQTNGKFNHFTTLTTLKLEVVEVQGASTGVNFVVPVGPTNITLGGSLGPKGKASRKIEFFSFPHTSEDLEACKPNSDLRRIDSGLGILEWLRELNALSEATEASPSSSTYTVNFTVNSTPTGSQSLKRTNSNGGSSSFSVSNHNNRTVSHSLSVTLTPKAKPKPAKRKRSIPKGIERLIIEHGSALERVNE